ncbi:MAG: SdrD B-like domain-containing protein [Bacteroidota bacterium]
MKLRHSFLCTAITVTLLFLCNGANAQAYLNFSKYAGGSSQESAFDLQVINGETYIAGVTSSADFPVTNGSTYSEKIDIVITKYGVNGNVVYSTYIGSKGDDYPSAMLVINGEVFISATSDSSGLPVTNGSSYQGGGLDIALMKINATGNISFCTYIGGDKEDYPVSNELQINGNIIYLAGNTRSEDFPVTEGGPLGGFRDGFVARVDATTGNILQSKYLGGNEFDNVNSVLIDNGDLYLVGSSNSSNLPITIGSLIPPNPIGSQHVMIYKLNANNLSTQYCRSLGGTNQEFTIAPQVSNGILHLLGYTTSPNFPVTNGTLPGDQSSTDGNFDCFYTKLNSNGSIGYSTYLSTEFLDFPGRLFIVGNETYIECAALDFTNTVDGKRLIGFYKINSNGTFAYSKYFDVGYTGNSYAETEIVNGEVLFTGITDNADFPVTNGSQFYDNGTGFFTKLDAAGNVSFSTFLGKTNNNYPTRIKSLNNKIYLLNGGESASYPVTDSSTFRGIVDHRLVILKTDGTPEYSGYIGGSDFDVSINMKVDNSGVYLFGYTRSVDYPVTSNILQAGGADLFVSKISFCPTIFDTANDTLSPGIQTVCKNGLAEKITGKKIIIDSTTLPLIYRNGIAEGQKNIFALYQWQKADAPTGPWTDIPNAVFKDYTPIIGSLPQYYRRLAFAATTCGGTLLHTSDTASVLVNSFTAPVVNAGGTVITCPASPVTLGGTPTASGGNPPYVSYQWDMGAGTTANPVVNPPANTIYTLIVTDNAGCKQIGQAVVFTYTANAGIDKGNCAGNPVQIGGSPIAGVPGVVYDWQPATGLNNNSIAQPLANTSIVTNYVLTLTVPKTGGGTCITKDSAIITPVPAPIEVNFAGPDKVLCLGDTLVIGTAAEPGFNYIWSPGFYLTSNTTATTKYYPGNLLMPTPNPAIINLTAQKSGCSFSDRVEVATIESRAGLFGCGPRIIGLPDRTPLIDETYQWSVVSGTGNFLGPDNLPEIPIGASAGGDATYGLTVTYNGHSCYSEVTVPGSCVGCLTQIYVDAKYKCPSYGVNGGDVTLSAVHTLQGEVIYRWSPQEGLTNYNSAVVKLTDNVSRLYIVTVMSAFDTTIKCFGAVMVNDPAASIPVFNAPDISICQNIPTPVGIAPVAGYYYEWLGNGLSDNYTSNPIATLPSQASYTVRILDMAGCEIKDTVVVNVENVQVDAGPDWIICGNGVVKLGTPATSNTTYLWEPQASPWQNGTDQNSAEPEVLLATDVTFTVTASTPLGCSTTDQVNVFINNSPGIADYPDITICKGIGKQIGNVSYPGVTYQWTPATGLSDATIAQPTADPETTTTYTLVANFPGGCSLPATDQVKVTVSDPSFSMPDISYCPGNGAIPLGASAPAGMTIYSWSPYELVSDYSIANPTTLNPPPNVATDFYLLVLNPDGCFYTDNIVISPSTIAPLGGADKILCPGTTTNIGDAANTTGPGITYSWNPATDLDNASGINPLFTGTTTGTFMYVLSRTENSCTSKDTVIVTVKDSLLKGLTAPVICQNTCVQVGTTPVTGVQYQWSPATGLSNATIANPIACVGTSAASYTVTAIDGNGCRAEQNIVVGVNALPAPQIIIPAVTACVGDTGIRFNPQITPAGSYTYLWSPDDGSLNDITTLNPIINIGSTITKQYSLQVTNSTSGCTNTATGNVTGNICSVLATIGDYMWFDNNSDGIQDVSEPGVSGMLIKLYNNAGINVATAVTDANGFYSFANVQPDTSYYVMFSKPTGYNFTLRDVGGTGSIVNSKANNIGRSTNFAIPASATILNIDAGIVPTGATPVMLLSFTGTLQNNKTVLLNWQTTAEYNNDYFDVERSSDGINFVAIGRVKGNGTTSLAHSYSLIDTKPLNGANYYRLRQVDFDGHYAYSNIVLVRISKSPVIAAFYNNQSNTIHISFNEQQSKTELKLFAVNGQWVKAASIKNADDYLLELPVLAGGVYMLQILTEKNIYTEKIFIGR